MEQLCSRVQELMPWLINGSLDSSETIMSLNHIRECEACKRELVFMATASQAAKSAWNNAPTPAFLGRLWTRFQEQTRFEQKTNSPSSDEAVKQGLLGATRGLFGPTRGLLGTTLRTVSYCLTPFGFAEDTLRLAYQSLVREFGEIIGGLVP